MNITRHNYETYFLLYTDNELPEQERMAVDNFVRENPDLKPELELLLQTSLPPETVSFRFKNDLLKQENPFTQEQLLQYLDNELDETESSKIAASISNNAAMKAEWEILQRTKLDNNDVVVFEHKKDLYRHENNVVAIFTWRRVAIAAAIIAALFFGATILFNKNTGNDEMATNDKSPVTSPVKEIKPDDEKQLADKKGPGENVIAAGNDQEPSAAENEKTLAHDTRLNKRIPVQQTGIAHHDEQSSVKERMPVPKQPKSNLENINNNERNKSNALAVEPKTEMLQKKIFSNELEVNGQKELSSHPLTAPDVEIKAITTNRYASVAMLAEQPAEENNNKILFMDEDKVNRSKLGGFLRKVKRTIERKSNIKTGNTIKIAGFEIAAR
jgi:hypothetical protein